jgi:FkbM family methyltransferase
MNSIDITYFGRTVSFPDLPRYRKFYALLREGAWEPATFNTLKQHLDRDTIYVDIGGWIGATPFWAAGLARQVIAVEPDPVCLEILNSYAPRYPNVAVIAGALSAEPNVVLHEVDGFGSSETSALDIGQGRTATAEGISVSEIMSHADNGPVFVKIDVEGYEYAAAAEISRFAQYDLRGVQLAVHPQLYEQSLKGNRLIRRLRAVVATWRLSRLFAGSLAAPQSRHYGNAISYCIFGVLLRRIPKHTDFVFLAPQR